MRRPLRSDLRGLPRSILSVDEVVRYASAHGGSALDIRTSTYAACAGLALVTGCADWPRFDHLPDDGASHAVDTPPGSLVTVTWSRVEEPDPDPGDDPTADGLPSAALSLGEGLLLGGALGGLGWSDEAVPTPLEDEACPGARGVRAPLPSGDYLGDVDVVLVDVPERATLCARLEIVDADAVGWDLVAFPVDACGIPGAALQDDRGAPLGADQGGPEGGWGAKVPAGRYAVLLGAYDPYDPEARLPYALGVSVVPRGPDGQAGVCPLLPSEVP